MWYEKGSGQNWAQEEKRFLFERTDFMVGFLDFSLAGAASDAQDLLSC